jgi:hypothetical protein
LKEKSLDLLPAQNRAAILVRLADPSLPKAIGQDIAHPMMRARMPPSAGGLPSSDGSRRRFRKIIKILPHIVPKEKVYLRHLLGPGVPDYLVKRSREDEVIGAIRRVAPERLPF